MSKTLIVHLSKEDDLRSNEIAFSGSCRAEDVEGSLNVYDSSGAQVAHFTSYEYWLKEDEDEDDE